MWTGDDQPCEWVKQKAGWRKTKLGRENVPELQAENFISAKQSPERL